MPVNPNDDRFYTDEDGQKYIDESDWEEDELDEALEEVDPGGIWRYIEEQNSKD